MHELDLLPVGSGKRSGDALALRFTRPDTGELAHVTIDAGYHAEGAVLVEHVRRRHGTNRLDLAIVTHPDQDHIEGMQTVLRELEVETLWIHRLHDHAPRHPGGRLPMARAVRDVVTLAERRGTTVVEPWAGMEAFGGALRVLGPDPAFYRVLVEEEVHVGDPRRPVPPLRLLRELWEQVTWRLPWEVPFDDYEGTTPRNDSSVVLALDLPGFRALLPADAGVPALHRALDVLDGSGLPPRDLDLVLVAHHGSKHNASSELLDRMLGPIGSAAPGPAFVSAAEGSPFHPSKRVVRAYERRGRTVSVTAGRLLRHAAP